MAADRTGALTGVIVCLLALSACTTTTSADSGAAPDASLPAPPTSVPPSDAGPLAGTSMPDPSQLGQGWDFRVEGGALEDGVGNDTPFQQREPAEIVLTTIPMGCEQRASSATPLNVLQATYQNRESGRFAVVLRMRFTTEDAAAAFAAARTNDLLVCRNQPDDPYSGARAPVLDVEVSDGRSAATYRLPGEVVTWTTLAAVDGTDLVTLDTDADPATLSWTPPRG